MVNDVYSEICPSIEDVEERVGRSRGEMLVAKPECPEQISVHGSITCEIHSARAGDGCNE